MARSPQVSATIDQELYDDISKMIENTTFSMSQMVAILLKQAVKERKRKRKNSDAKEDTV
jgi:hypothetical protein